MAEGFAKSNSLVYINLSRNEVTAEASQILSQALMKKVIEGLDLSSNPLGDLGVRQICQLIIHGSHRLVRIDLSNCSFSNQVGNNLFSAIVGKANNLIRLNIAGNLFGQ
jgi:Ran GTPase-activating protein (RanGAP) involved in mRNA processing and transport